MDIKIRYTWKRTSDGHMWQPIISIDEFEKGKQHFPPMDSDWEIIGRDLWTGFHDSEGNEVYGGDKVLLPSKHGEYTTVVSWDGTAWIIDPNKSKISDYRSIIVVKRGKIVGNVHINNQSQKS